MDCGQRPHLNKICAQSDTSSEVDNALFIELQMTPVRYVRFSLNGLICLHSVLDKAGSQSVFKRT